MSAANVCAGLFSHDPLLTVTDFMGLENREYYRDSYEGMPSFSFNTSSFVIKIIIVNVAIFFIDTFTSEVANASEGTHWLSYMMAVKMDQPWQIWTYLTHGFAHAGFMSQTGLFHILGNMLALFFLGPQVESRLGSVEFLRFYLISIVVSGIGFTLLKIFVFGDTNSYILGASGAVTAVVILFVLMYPHAKLLMFGVIPMPAWLLGILLLLTDFFRAFNPESHIAWEAHLIGAAFGAAYFFQKWNFSRFQPEGLADMFKSKTKLKVHNPDGSAGVDEKLKEKADAILEKISEQGEESLTSRERKTLNKYSQQLRKNRE